MEDDLTDGQYVVYVSVDAVRGDDGAEQDYDYYYYYYYTIL